MRLFDKVCSQGPDCRRHAELFEKHGGVVLAIDAIATHYAESPQQEWDDEKDFPYCRPPWDVCFVEWNNPTRVLTIDGWIDNPPSQMGVMCVSFPMTPERRIELRRLFGDEIMSKSDLALRMDSVIYVRGKIEPSLSVVVCMSSGGEITGWAIVGDPDDILRWREFSELKGLDINCLACELKNPVLLSFTFANCANVKLEDVTSDLQPEPKIRRRLKLPEVKRYTLNIAGHVSKPSREAGKGPQGVMPFHLCRGHFATYTADKPMFGNPKLVGRFWHPPHMRGKKEHGEVEKDYRIDG